MTDRPVTLALTREQAQTFVDALSDSNCWEAGLAIGLAAGAGAFGSAGGDGPLGLGARRDLNAELKMAMDQADTVPVFRHHRRLCPNPYRVALQTRV